ncbi:hypothetical protein PHYSODRAFT_342827 [Phytophthora sojae]|uniref:Uncharacterized protein n=1 Tax=Phytophthora sojae (strain P6497) TaxID=1094619 RepID=G5AHR5_PHYSP|nr:hypothetical protein PHYSODRAFT_342827 [Phytophthora sojae]EGZ04986.1 hypothetical protein PHYSODRAFT_342827 [Phytophthora sojae]|eukprot:XP_009539616.1 hypothetical protein PHYSODRAFT_342827 [Phytophthora sojae]
MDVERLERLYESEDDDVGEGTSLEVDTARSTSAKRAREAAPIVQGEARLEALRQRLEDDPNMVRDIDQLIALRQANVRSSNTTALVTTAGLNTKAQFKPSRQQVLAHGLLVDGK